MKRPAASKRSPRPLRTVDPTLLARVVGGWFIPIGYPPPPPPSGGVSSPRDIASGL